MNPLGLKPERFVVAEVNFNPNKSGYNGRELKSIIAFGQLKPW